MESRHGLAVGVGAGLAAIGAAGLATLSGLDWTVSSPVFDEQRWFWPVIGLFALPLFGGLYLLLAPYLGLPTPEPRGAATVRDAERREESQRDRTPLISLEGGAVSLAAGGGQRYDVRVRVHIDGGGFGNQLILNLHSVGAPMPAATAVLDYVRPGAEYEVVLTCPVRSLPLASESPRHVSLVQIRATFTNPDGQPVHFVQSGRVDLDQDRLRFTAAPEYDWPWDRNKR